MLTARPIQRRWSRTPSCSQASDLFLLPRTRIYFRSNKTGWAACSVFTVFMLLFQCSDRVMFRILGPASLRLELCSLFYYQSQESNDSTKFYAPSSLDYRNKVETTNRCEALKYFNIFKMCPKSKYLLVAHLPVGLPNIWSIKFSLNIFTYLCFET